MMSRRASGRRQVLQELWLDGNKLELRGGVSWGEVLEQVETEHLATGRIIRTIAFDGDELDDFRSEEVVQRPLDQLSSVEVTTVGLEEFSRELVAGAPSHLDQVSVVLAQAVSFYRQDLPVEGAKQLHAALIGFDMLMKLVASISVVWQEELADIADNVGSVALNEDGLESLREALEGLVRCQEDGATEDLARAIEELIPRLAPWSALMVELERRLCVDAASAGSAS